MTTPDQILIDHQQIAMVTDSQVGDKPKTAAIPLPPAFSKITTGNHNYNIEDYQISFNNNSSKYSGLSNQGSTCYLNALLQSLFMTPEFRINLLNWKYEEKSHGQKADCIPYQLQKLFARLQLKTRYAEETKALTKSFQWDSSEVFFQHDIQELSKKLFEAIEMSMGPDDHNFINDLYEGSSSSIVECQECNYISEKVDKFLDITLPIRNDFEKIYNRSLGMALSNFLKPELLEKDNQYFCEKCNKKVDALKYMKFQKMPKILFISLSRFEYDMMLDARKKINDRVPFPTLLNINNYIKDYKGIKYDKNIDENEDECLLIEANPLQTNDNSINKNCEKEKISNSSDMVIDNIDKPTEQKIDNKYEEKILEYFNDGPLVYELFSIVIHSGNAMGGHYYAYIKSFEDGQWYNFNDSSVSQINVTHIKNIFGGTSSSTSSATGYVLMYRIISKDKKNFTSIESNVINDYLKKDIDEENVKLIEEEKQWREKSLNVTVKVYFNSVQKLITVKKLDTLNSFKLEILNEFGLEEKIKSEDVRIRAYNNFTNKPLEYYHDEAKTIEENSIISYKSYTLEFRNNDGDFEQYDADSISLQIFNWVDDNEGKPESEFKKDLIKFSNRDTMANLRKKLCEMYNYHPVFSPLYIFRKVEISANNFSIVEILKQNEDLNKELYRCAILDNTKIFIELKNENFQSKFTFILSEKLSNVTVRFNLPVNIVSELVDLITVNDYKMDLELEVKRTSTIGKMKEQIAEYLALKPEEFLLRKYNHNGNELKNLDESLFEATNGVNSAFYVYVEYGSPMTADELKINTIFCEYDYSTFKIFPYRLIEIGVLKIKVHWTIGQLKKILIQEAKDKLSLELDEDYVLVRENITDRPGRIFLDDLVIRDLNFIENKKIIIHEYRREKLRFNNDQIEVSLRFWDEENWILSELIEVQLTKKLSLLEMAGIINSYFPNIQPENILVHRVVNGYNLYMDDINKFEFVRIYEKCDSLIDGFPFFLTFPGNLLLIKDASQTPRQPTEEEKIFYCRPQMSECTALVLVPDSNTNINSNSNKPQGRIAEMINQLEKDGFDPATRTFNKVKYKEKGIVITVKKNKVENEEQLNGNDSIADSSKDDFKEKKENQNSENLVTVHSVNFPNDVQMNNNQDLK